MAQKVIGPYAACSTSRADDPTVWGVDGPGGGFGYHAWYLHPENTFPTLEGAQNAARLMNIAFAQGKKARSGEIAALLQDR